MIILGIDPGLAATGWAALKKEKKPKLIDYGCIKTEKKDGFDKRLDFIFKEVKKITLQIKPQAVAIEGIFFAQNSKTAIKVAQAMGVIKLACQKSKVPIYEYAPLHIKTTVAGYGRAQKKEMESMIIKKLKLKKRIKPSHAVDAIAVSLTHLFSNNLSGAGGS